MKHSEQILMKFKILKYFMEFNKIITFLENLYVF